MSMVLICPNGHHWELSVDGLDSGDSALLVCPVCGFACSATPVPPNPDETVVNVQLLINPTLPSSRRGVASLPAVPGYEVVCLLGQGGMGKVYKARHLRLDRLVALKMISTDRQASAQQLARFQAEAEALAKLHHPHIVQIYEVNECDGQPYFSLELLDGGSLDRKLAGVPQPPRQAAQMIEVVARAVHDAHQHGIVHRDLKPANLLLTSEGELKRTYFGVAKRL